MNREIIQPSGAGIYPLTGDVVSQAGNPTVRVVGLLGIPITPSTFQGGEVLEYSTTTNNWTPTLRACIRVNSAVASDDYTIAVNTVPVTA